MSVSKVSSDFVIPLPPAKKKKPHYTDEQLKLISETSKKYLTVEKRKSKITTPPFEVKNVNVLPSFTRLVETLRATLQNPTKSLQKEMEIIKKALKDIRSGVFLNANLRHISNALLDFITKEISKVKENSHLIDIQRFIETVWETKWFDGKDLEYCLKLITQKYRESTCMGSYDLIASSLKFIRTIELEIKNKQDLDPFKALLDTKALEKIHNLPENINDSNIDSIHECLLAALRAPVILRSRKLSGALFNFAYRIDKSNPRHLTNAGNLITKACEYKVKFEEMDFQELISLGVRLLRLSSVEFEESEESYRSLALNLFKELKPHTPLIKINLLHELFACFGYQETPEKKKRIFEIYCEYLGTYESLQQKSVKILTTLQSQPFNNKWLHDVFTVAYVIEKIDVAFLFDNRKIITPLNPDIYFQFLERVLIDHSEYELQKLQKEFAIELNPNVQNWMPRIKSLLNTLDKNAASLGQSKIETLIEIIVNVFSDVFHDEFRPAGSLSKNYTNEFSPLILSVIKTLEDIHMKDQAEHFKKRAKSTQFLFSFETELIRARDLLEISAKDYSENDVEKSIDEVLSNLESMLGSGFLKVDFEDQESINKFLQVVNELHYVMCCCLFYRPSVLFVRYLQLLEKTLIMASENGHDGFVLQFFGKLLRMSVFFPDTIKAAYVGIAPIIKKQKLTIKESSRRYLQDHWNKEEFAVALKMQKDKTQDDLVPWKLVNVIGLVGDDKLLSEGFTKVMYERFFDFFRSCIEIIFKSKTHLQELQEIQSSNPTAIRYLPEKYPILSTLYFLQNAIDKLSPAQKNLFTEQRNKLLVSGDPKLLIALARLIHNTARATN